MENLNRTCCGIFVVHVFEMNCWTSPLRHTSESTLAARKSFACRMGIPLRGDSTRRSLSPVTKQNCCSVSTQVVTSSTTAFRHYNDPCVEDGKTDAGPWHISSTHHSERRVRERSPCCRKESAARVHSRTLPGGIVQYGIVEVPSALASLILCLYRLFFGSVDTEAQDFGGLSDAL